MTTKSDAFNWVLDFFGFAKPEIGETWVWIDTIEPNPFKQGGPIEVQVLDIKDGYIKWWYLDSQQESSNTLVHFRLNYEKKPGAVKFDSQKFQADLYKRTLDALAAKIDEDVADAEKWRAEEDRYEYGSEDHIRYVKLQKMANDRIESKKARLAELMQRATNEE